MKRIICILLCLSVCAMLFSCGEKYEDTNGEEDFSLQSITDEEIIFLTTGSSAMTYKEESDTRPVFTAEYHGKDFNGVESIYRNFYNAGSELNIYIGKMEAVKGNLRICVIKDTEIFYDIPVDKDYETYTFEDISGHISVHVAGESAEFEFYIDIY